MTIPIKYEMLKILVFDYYLKKGLELIVFWYVYFVCVGVCGTVVMMINLGRNFHVKTFFLNEEIENEEKTRNKNVIKISRNAIFVSNFIFSDFLYKYYFSYFFVYLIFSQIQFDKGNMRLNIMCVITFDVLSWFYLFLPIFIFHYIIVNIFSFLFDFPFFFL